MVASTGGLSPRSVSTLACNAFVETEVAGLPAWAASWRGALDESELISSWRSTGGCRGLTAIASCPPTALNDQAAKMVRQA